MPAWPVCGAQRENVEQTIVEREGVLQLRYDGIQVFGYRIVAGRAFAFMPTNRYTVRCDLAGAAEGTSSRLMASSMAAMVSGVASTARTRSSRLASRLAWKT